MQCRVNYAVAFFKDALFAKYGFTWYADPDQPCVFNGMSTDDDFAALSAHRSRALIVWCGSDSLKPHNIGRFKPNPNWHHIAKSLDIQRTLSGHGIDSVVIPVTPTVPRFAGCARERSEKVYVYGVGEGYGSQLLPQIKRAIKHPIIHVGRERYTKDELAQVYTESFIGLRLTPHDGLPNTVLELGLTGRRCVHNGSIPSSIPWRTVDDVVVAIEREYANRHIDDTREIADSVIRYIDIGTDWLSLGA